MMDNAATTQEAHEEALFSMGDPVFTDELIALLRIRAPLIYITCNEEYRLLAFFKHLSVAKSYKTEMWDCHRGLLDLLSGKKSKIATDDVKDPDIVLEKIIESIEHDEVQAQSMISKGISGNIFLLLDYHRFLKDALPSTERMLKRIHSIEDSMTSVIVVAPHFEFTPAIENLFHVLDFPLPNKKEILDTMYDLVDAVKDKIKGIAKNAKLREEEIIRSATGLTIVEAQAAFSKSVIKHKEFNIPTIIDIKKQIISRKEVLEYCVPNVTMDDVGGLTPMIEWFKKRKLAFSDKAKEYGLITPPSGTLLLGIPGCVLGKTKIKIKKISDKGKLKIFEE